MRSLPQPRSKTEARAKRNAKRVSKPRETGVRARLQDISQKARQFVRTLQAELKTGRQSITPRASRPEDAFGIWTERWAATFGDMAPSEEQPLAQRVTQRIDAALDALQQVRAGHRSVH